MSIKIIVLILITLSISAAVIIIYNSLIKCKNLALEGWSGVDVQLKRRTDLIPQLLEYLKTYMAHESGLLETIASIRAQATEAKTHKQRQEAELNLSKGLYNVMAIVENYPNLKANQNFLDMQKTLTNVEDQIQLSRRYYNAAVRDYNIKAEIFPGKIIATFFKFKPMQFFDLEV